MKPQEILEIMKLAERLKCTTRHCDTSTGRRESVAEHCWRLCLFAMLLEDEFPDTDINKVIKMCIIHDMGEAFIGDIACFDKTSWDEGRERRLLRQWVDTLPFCQKKQFTLLYDEMDEMSTPEAKLYKALDKLEAVIQHNESDISTWLDLEYELQLTYGEENVRFSPYLIKLKEAIDEVTRKKIDDSRE